MNRPSEGQKPNCGSDPKYVYLPVPGARIEQEVNLLDYWRVVMRRKWLVLSIALLLAAAVGAILFVMKPTYVAEVSMLYVHTDSGSSGSGSTSGSGGTNEGGGRETSTTVSATVGSEQEATAILTSRQFTNRFIEEMNLLPVLFASKWNTDTGEWILKPGESAPDMWDAFELFDKKIRGVSSDRTTGLAQLAIQWNDPRQAAEWANALAARLNATLKTRDVAYAQKSLDYLTEALDRFRAMELQDTLYNLIEKQLETIMLANVTDEYAFRVIDPAVAPKFPVWTLLKRILAIAAAGITGLMMGVFLVLFMDFLDRQRKEPEEHDDDRIYQGPIFE